MRTTIEIKDEHRAKLLELAARRGEKGFSRLVGEAIERYLESLEDEEQAREDALELRGALSDEQADELEARVGALRESWR